MASRCRNNSSLSKLPEKRKKKKQQQLQIQGSGVSFVSGPARRHGVPSADQGQQTGGHAAM